MEYVNINNIILNINEKDKWGNYPFLVATKNNNIEIIKLLEEYACKDNIILNINEKGRYGYYPLLIAIEYNYIEIIELLQEFASKKKYCFKS